MTIAELDRYIEVLEEKAAELKQMIASGKEVIIPIQNSSDLADQTQFTGMQELEMRTLDSSTTKLHQIEAALQRLRDGTFGVCIDCEENISPKRLKAVP